jgi:hypothetical protein
MRLSIFKVFMGRTNASGGPHAARVFETADVKHNLKLLFHCLKEQHL